MLALSGPLQHHLVECEPRVGFFTLERDGSGNGRHELLLEPVGFMADVLVHVTDGYIKRAARLAAEIVALADGGYAELARVQPCQKLRQLVHQFEAGCQSQRGGHVTLTRVVEVNGHEA